MRKLTLLLLLISFSLQAQKVTVKKGEVLVDKNKVGTIEKIKVKGQGNHFKVFDNEKNHIFTAKKVSEESKIFGKLKRIRYHIIECIQQKDTIGIDNNLFALSEKGISKELIKKGILSAKGYNLTEINNAIAKTNSKPKYAREKLETDKEFIKNINYLVSRDKSTQIYVDEIGTSSEYSIIDSRNVNRTKFKIFQGDNSSDDGLIGYAYLETPEIGMNYMVILNSKGSPIAHFDSFKYHTLFPLTELEFDSSITARRMEKPIKAIHEFVKILIDKNKL